jgi:tetratricopeptide (TPR) repeat protein
MRAASTLLDRAAGLMDGDDPDRVDVLVLLGTASAQSGDLERARTALDEALDASTRMGDRQREIRARLARFQLLSATQPEGVTAQIEREAQAAIPVLEELDDDEGLARAWNSVCEVGLMWCHASEMEHASERAADHAERAGDRAALSDALSWRMIAAWLGMAPPDAGMRLCQEVRARAPDDRLLEAIAGYVEGSCDGILGGFDEGRRKHLRAHAILVDLGVKLNIGGMTMWNGSLEAMAGDLHAADRAHREGTRVLESIGEIGYLSTHLGYHARVLYALGRFDEAAEKTDLAEHLAASDDVASQTIWRQLRAKLLAREGNTDTAVALAEEAASMTEGTDCWDTLNMAFEDLGEVYALVGRRDDAIRALEKAIDVCERKGAIVVADSLRAKVASLEAGS